MKLFAADEVAQEAELDFTEVRAELWDAIRGQPDDEVLAALAGLSEDFLDQLYSDAGPEGDMVPCECECGLSLRVTCEVCGMEPDYRPGPNFGHYLSPVVLAAIEDTLFRSPLDPQERDTSLYWEDRVTALSKRESLGLGLFHPDDVVCEDPESLANRDLELPVFRLSGWDGIDAKTKLAAGLAGVTPSKNGDPVVGALRRRRPGIAAGLPDEPTLAEIVGALRREAA